MSAITLRYADYLAPGEQFVFVRSVLPRRRPATLHDHDYPELFWIQNGRARHVVNGARQDLVEGDLVFVRPHDRHGLQGLEPETRLVNVLVHPDRVAALAARYPELRGRFFWHEARLPTVHHRDPRALAELSGAALRLEAGARSGLRIDAFVLRLAGELLEASAELPEPAPPWLAAACAAAERPEVFRRGAAGLVAAAGRGHAHVARVVRQHLGMTPSDFVNRIRMDFAARQLAGTADSLAEIAQDCGFENMSHFHKLFRARFGMTPRAYRVKHQRELVRPE